MHSNKHISFVSTTANNNTPETFGKSRRELCVGGCGCYANLIDSIPVISMVISCGVFQSRIINCS